MSRFCTCVVHSSLTYGLDQCRSQGPHLNARGLWGRNWSWILDDPNTWSNGSRCKFSNRIDLYMSLFCCRDVHALAGLMMTGIYFYGIHIHMQVGTHLLPSGHPVDASWTMFSFFVVLACAQGSFKSLFCKLCLTCIYLRVRLASHCYSVCANWLF